MAGVESITRELEKARQLALREGHAGGAASASMGKPKLHGLLFERREVKDVSPVTSKELLIAQAERLGIDPKHLGLV